MGGWYFIFGGVWFVVCIGLVLYVLGCWFRHVGAVCSSVVYCMECVDGGVVCGDVVYDWILHVDHYSAWCFENKVPSQHFSVM